MIPRAPLTREAPLTDQQRLAEWERRRAREAEPTAHKRPVESHRAGVPPLRADGRYSPEPRSALDVLQPNTEFNRSATP